MKQQILELTNLNNRKYVHGTSIVKGVLDAIGKEYSAYNFEIRLYKKLMTQPAMIISMTEMRNSDVVAAGKFMSNGAQLYFYLVPTNSMVVSSLTIDEDMLDNRVVKNQDGWGMTFLEADNIHVCYNSVSKLSNQLLFANQGVSMDTNKQTWFVGCSFPSLGFLAETSGVIGVSSSYFMLTPNCMKRTLTLNGEYVGERVCVYA